MRNRKISIYPLLFISILFLFDMQAAHSAVDDMGNFCSIPPFVATGTKPNLLLMIDNSASMNDLAYINAGTYCYDQTYSSTKTGGYAGYFDKDTYYQYDFTNNYFYKIASFPESISGNSCNTNSSTVRYIANTLCITGANLDVANSTAKSISGFAAKGDYLNWISASKIDIQKQILTGGKYDGQYLVAESRGCIGRGFVKEALTGDYVEAGTNTSLKISFGVRGPIDTSAPTTPSPGGQTYIEIYAGADYDFESCQDTLNVIADTASTLPNIRTSMNNCLRSLTTADASWENKQKLSFNAAIQACWAYNKNTAIGTDEISSMRNQCSGNNSVYSLSPGICSDTGERCTLNAECDSNDCIRGPEAILPGDAAYICSQKYAGACYTGGPGDSWNSNSSYWQGSWTGTWSETPSSIVQEGTFSGADCVKAAHSAFCGSYKATDVVDPTDDPSITSNYENLPAILMDTSLRAQLDSPLKTMRVRLMTATAPANLIQKYSDSILMGAMSFNFNGSKTECDADLVPCPKTCTTDRTRLCGSKLDCPSSELSSTECNVNATQDNFDGAKIISYIEGTCSGDNAACIDDIDCASATPSQRCNITVGDYSSGLIKSINDINASSWTPFAEGFHEAVGYFARSSSDQSRSDLRLNTADYVLTKNPSGAWCRSNNVLLITDGMSTADSNSTVNTIASKYASLATAGEYGGCDNFAGSKNLPVLTWIGKNTNIGTFLTSAPTYSTPEKNNESINTYIVYSGPEETDTSLGLCDPVTFMNKAAENGGTSAAIVATDPDELETKLDQTLGSIASKAASGSAVSVLTTSARGVGSMLQAYFYPTLHLDNGKQIQWLGYTQNIWIDPTDELRDDYSSGTADFQLNLYQDRVMKLNTDPASNATKVGFFTTDSDGTGRGLASCQTTTVLDFNQIVPIWEGGKKLSELTDTDSRYIFTAITGGESMGSAGGLAFTTDNAGAVSSALNPDAIYTAERIIRYTRGEALENPSTYDSLYSTGSYTFFRDRTLDTDRTQVWKLGDVINSTPKVVGNIPQNTYFIDYGDTSYYNFISSDAFRKRGSIAVIGSNDGMLHAFRLGYLKDKGPFTSPNTKALFKNYYGAGDTHQDEIGKEAWAYIPYHALPYMKYYASPEYAGCHIYGVDLSAKIYDVSINGEPGGARNAASWRTILIGGMRFGGACENGTDPAPPLSSAGFSSYFAIDLTDYLEDTGQYEPGDNRIRMPKPLWEYNEPDLGYTTSSPAVVRTGAMAANGNWYVALGSGPTKLAKSNPDQDIDRGSTGYIYILDLETGTLVKKISLGHNAIVSDILSIDADKDYHSEKLYFGTSFKSESVWAGKLMSISLPDDMTTLCGSGTGPHATCTERSILFEGNYPFTASPDVAKDENGNVWIYAGSGKYFSSLDEQDSSQQVFVGIKESATIATADVSESCPTDCSSLTALCDVTQCTATAFVPTVGGRTQVCVFDGSTSGFQTVITSVTNGSSNAPQNAKGWVIFLDNKERVISRPLAAGGIVDFLTYVPNSSVCTKGGNSYLYAVDYVRGSAPTTIAIRGHPNSTTAAGENDQVTIERKVLLGPGAPPTGEAIIITPPKEGQDRLKKKIQVSTGVIVETENKPVLSIISKILNWLKK